VSGDAVTGFSEERFGVFGGSTNGTGVGGEGASRGVSGTSAAGHAIHGQSDTGFAGYFNGKVFVNNEILVDEIRTPAAPVANRAKLFVRDNGSGKTQLCVRFHTGAVKVLATQS